MVLRDLILKNRSYRRFYESEKVSRETLTSLVDLARLSPSGANLQPLKFILSHEPDKNAKIFGCLSWAGYLTEWSGPEPGERPSAYIVILGDETIRSQVKHDQGIAAQSMLLGAIEAGLGGCIIGSVNRELLRTNLNIPDRFQILLVLALGRPRETVVLEDVGPDGNICYWRDKKGIHHVPKRTIENLIIDPSAYDD